jgi:hypothetical protein
MAYVIVATRLGFGSEPLSLECDVRCWGPFRDDETAHRRLTTYKRAVDRAGLSDDWQLGLEYVFPGRDRSWRICTTSGSRRARRTRRRGVARRRRTHPLSRLATRGVVERESLGYAFAYRTRIDP